MDFNALLEEAQALARPCLYLRPEPNGTAPVGFWGGAGIVPPPDATLEHMLSIDGVRIPQVPVAGWLSLYRFGDGDDWAGLGPWREVAPLGQPLYGYASQSLPPLEALRMAETPRIQAWRNANGWAATDPEVLDDALATAYINVWCAQYPLYTEQAMAMLGGWSMAWPEGDWWDLADSRLLLLTIADAEPWYEVLLSPDGALDLRPRIT